MRRTIRCVDGFADGLCREPGCPHEERRGSGLRRQKPKVCKTCRGPASVKAWDSGWLCEGCASIKAERGPRGPLYLLTALVLACGGADLTNCGGDFQMSQPLEGPPVGSCMVVEIAEGSGGQVGIGDDCPVGRCVVLLEDSAYFRIWKDTLSSDPEYSAATLELGSFGAPPGECPAVCQ